MDVASRLDRISSRLKKRGLRMTRQRGAIIQALLKLGHPNAGQVHERVRALFPATSLATVYSTLALLHEMGEMQELDLGSAASHFDALNPCPHPHLICSRCGTVVDARADYLGDLVAGIGASDGTWTVSRRLDCWAVCPRCQADSSRS